jgi:hypothetical protein
MKHKIVGTVLTGLFAVALMPSMAATAQSQDDSCSVTRAAGTYAVSDSGTIVGIGPRAAVALLTLDAEGSIKGNVTASLNGSVTTGTLSGTYTVSPDCTGTTTFSEYDQSGNLLITATVALVWDADMSEFRFLFTSVELPNGTSLTTVINGDAKKTDQPQSQQNTRTASPSVSDDTLGSPQTVSPSATGISGTQLPTVSLSTTQLWFIGYPRCRYATPATVTLTNDGPGVLDISGIAIYRPIGSQTTFSQTNTCGSTLGVGESCSITVTWSQVGSGLGSLLVTDNGVGSPQSVSLRGSYVCPK